MFGAIRRFFSKNGSNDPPESKPKLRLAVDLLEDDDTIKITAQDDDDETLEGIAERAQQHIQEVRNEGDNMPVYLATLDTTNRPEVKDRGLQGGLKNFYLVRAASAEKAREMILGTFAHRPAILNQIQYSVSITELKRIVDVVTSQYPMWSYIPMRRGVRAPGQQATPPSQQVNPNDRDEVIPMREPPQVITPPSQNDTPKKPAPEAVPQQQGQFDPAMMQNMMAMFAQMMGGQMPQMPQQQPQSPGFDGVPGVSVTRADPNSDPELAHRMQSVTETAQARHSSHTGIGDAIVGVEHGDMDELSQAEAQARAEVEAFKRLPPEKRSQGIGNIDMNDNSDIDIDSFRQIRGRIGEGSSDGELDL